MLSVGEILRTVARAGGRIANASDPQVELAKGISGMAPLVSATSDQISFFFNKEYQSALLTCKAGVLITGEAFVGPLSQSGLPLWRNSTVIACKDPYLAMALVSEKLARDEVRRPGIHPTAIIDETVELGSRVSVGPYCVVESGAKLGSGTILTSHCYVGAGTEVGERAILYPNVVVYDQCVIGARVRIHSGTVIGADGFGYAPVKDEQGKVQDHQKIWHVGKVVIGDDVEIGAHVSIDRGTFDDTRIGSKAKIDNQVQIGHNVQIGEGAVICGKAGLAGSSKVGSFAYVGGLAGIGNGIEIGERANVGGMSSVNKDVPPGLSVMGQPAREVRVHLKLQAELSKLAGGRYQRSAKKTGERERGDA